MLMLHPEPPPLLALEMLSDIESPVYSPAPTITSASSEDTVTDWGQGDEDDGTQERQESEDAWWDDGSRIDLCEILASVGLRGFYWWFADHELGTTRRLARYVDGNVMRTCEQAGMAHEEALRFTRVFNAIRNVV